MKKRILKNLTLFLISIALLLTTGLYAFAYNGNQTYKTMYVVNCNESITLRTAPSTSAAEIRQIPLGAPVSYVETAANGFYKVIYLGNTGYALASYLSETYTGGSKVPSQSTAIRNHYAGEPLWVVNCKESITLRRLPSTSAAEICQMPLGSVVYYVADSSNGFYLVNYNGLVGYALAGYLY